MAEELDNTIEIIDDDGTTIKCELYDIVEFDGNGQYRILRGAGQNSCWNTLEV